MSVYSTASTCKGLYFLPQWAQRYTQRAQGFAFFASYLCALCGKFLPQLTQRYTQRAQVREPLRSLRPGFAPFAVEITVKISKQVYFSLHIQSETSQIQSETSRFTCEQACFTCEQACFTCEQACFTCEQAPFYMRASTVLHASKRVLHASKHRFIREQAPFYTRAHVFYTRTHVFYTRAHVFYTRAHVFLHASKRAFTCEQACKTRVHARKTCEQACKTCVPNRFPAMMKDISTVNDLFVLHH